MRTLGSRVPQDSELICVSLLRATLKWTAKRQKCEPDARMWADDHRIEAELRAFETRINQVIRIRRTIMAANPGKAGPKGALEPDVQKSIPGNSEKPPKSGPPGAEGNNTRRDFVQLPKNRQGKRK